MGQKSQQALNTMLAALFAVLLAERFDTVFAASGSRDMFVGAATVTLGGVFSALLELGRQLALRAGAKYGLDMTKILGGIVPLALVLTLGCSSTIPTSSSATKEETKGGAMSGPSISWVEPDGPNIQCAGGTAELPCRLTDPPTAEETTALAKFGESLLGVLRLPFDVLAAFGRALSGAAAP